MSATSSCARNLRGVNQALDIPFSGFGKVCVFDFIPSLFGCKCADIPYCIIALQI